MANEDDKAVKGLQREGESLAERAFKLSLGNVETLAKTLAPVGHYARSRGKPGRSGGDLRQSLRVEYTGQQGAYLTARLSSALPYAARQHNEEFHHPGLYTGAPGDKYAAKYFERAVEMIFGGGKDPSGRFSGGPGRDPKGRYLAAPPATFKEIMDDLRGRK